MARVGIARARSSEDKGERRAGILVAARDLFERMPYLEITMAEVATRAALAKGTLYLYFPTKESLFLALQEHELLDWFDDIDAALAGSPDCGIDAAVGHLSASVARHPALVRLLAILHTTLERNIDLATARAFKRMTRGRLLATGALLERCLPWLVPGDGARLLLQIYAVAIGLQHLADPAPVIREVLADPDMALFLIDFDDQFTRAVRLLLLGLETQKREDPVG